MEFALGVVISLLISGTGVCFGLLIWRLLHSLWVWLQKKYPRRPKPVSFEGDSWYEERAPRNVVSLGATNPFVASKRIMPVRPKLSGTPAKSEAPSVQKTDDEPDFLSTFVAAEIASSVFDSTPSTDYSTSDTSSSDSFSFGGGDSGGGGASGDW